MKLRLQSFQESLQGFIFPGQELSFLFCCFLLNNFTFHVSCNIDDQIVTPESLRRVSHSCFQTFTHDSAQFCSDDIAALS